MNAFSVAAILCGGVCVAIIGRRIQFSAACRNPIRQIEAAIDSLAAEEKPSDQLAREWNRILETIDGQLQRCWWTIDSPVRQEWLRMLVHLRAAAKPHWKYAVAWKARPNDKTEFSELVHRINFVCLRHNCPSSQEVQRRKAAG